MWRMPRGRLPKVAAAGWAAGALAGVAVPRRTRTRRFRRCRSFLRSPSPPAVPCRCRGLRVRARRVSQSMRFGGAFLALLVPAMAMYPSLSAFAIQAKERLIATEYGPQAASMRDDLQQRLLRALEQIDELPGLPALVTAPADDDTTTNRAFAVWSSTDLEKYRVTSAVELYGARRATPQPLRASSSRIRSAAVPGGRLQLGPDRRCLADWRERVARAAREPRRLRRQSSGRRHRRPGDARLPHAAVHRVAESVSRVAAAGSPGAGGRRVGAGRRVRLLWMEPRSVVRVGHERLDASRCGVRAHGRVAHGVLDQRRARQPAVPRLLHERSAAASTRSAIR